MALRARIPGLWTPGRVWVPSSGGHAGTRQVSVIGRFVSLFLLFGAPLRVVVPVLKFRGEGIVLEPPLLLLLCNLNPLASPESPLPFCYVARTHEHNLVSQEFFHGGWKTGNKRLDRKPLAITRQKASARRRSRALRGPRVIHIRVPRGSHSNPHRPFGNKLQKSPSVLYCSRYGKLTGCFCSPSLCG